MSMKRVKPATGCARGIRGRAARVGFDCDRQLGLAQRCPCRQGRARWPRQLRREQTGASSLMRRETICSWLENGVVRRAAG